MFDCPPDNTVISLKPTSSPTPPPTGKTVRYIDVKVKQLEEEM